MKRLTFGETALCACAVIAPALPSHAQTIGAVSWDKLKCLVREWQLEDPARPQGIVLRTKADCLRICAEGPILLIWPEGIVYGGVTPERIERILAEHVIGGQPIEAWILRRWQFQLPKEPTRSNAH